MAKAWFTVGLWAAYALTFPSLYHGAGPGVGAVGLLAVAISAWLWGLRGGLLAGAGGTTLNILLYRLAGEPFGLWLEWAVPGAVAILIGGFVGYLQLLRQSLEAQQQLILHQSQHDALTGLLNREALHETLARMLAGTPDPFAVFYLDMDGFKAINDALGHAGGDEVLRSVAQRLSSLLGDACWVARAASDEFVVVGQLVGAEAAAALAAKLLAVLGVAHKVEGEDLVAPASIGVSRFPRDGTSPHALLTHAERALTRAKREGKSTYRLHDAGKDERDARGNRLLLDLHKALAHNEFELVYQPVVAPSCGTVVAVEALLRWNHPELGQLAPGAFLGLAESTSLMVPIGEWVLRTACRQAAAWRHAGHGQLRVLVNVSAAQFTHAGFVTMTQDALQDAGLPAAQLELEITETKLMDDIDKTARILARLERLGVSAALDDFGAGHSSLRYLRKLPLRTLKLDRSFLMDAVRGGPEGAQAQSIIRLVVDLAHSMGLRVVAEGVETREQWDLLVVTACDLAQGYLFSRPLPAEEVDALLHNRARLGLGEVPA